MASPEVRIKCGSAEKGKTPTGGQTDLWPGGQKVKVNPRSDGYNEPLASTN